MPQITAFGNTDFKIAVLFPGPHPISATVCGLQSRTVCEVNGGLCALFLKL